MQSMRESPEKPTEKAAGQNQKSGSNTVSRLTEVEQQRPKIEGALANQSSVQSQNEGNAHFKKMKTQTLKGDLEQAVLSQMHSNISPTNQTQNNSSKVTPGKGAIAIINSSNITSIQSPDQQPAN